MAHARTAGVRRRVKPLRTTVSPQKYPRAKKLTGNPNPRISPMSLNRPFTTTPAAPRTFARAAMSPPKQAEGRLGGWEMNMILPGALESAKWVGGVGAAVEVVGTIWVVGWGVRVCVFDLMGGFSNGRAKRMKKKENSRNLIKT